MKQQGIRIGHLWLHRLEQWDLECWPILAAHWSTPNRSQRIFCLWRWGIAVGPFLLTRRMLRLGRRIYRSGTP